MKQYGLPFIPPHELSGLAADTPLLLGFSGGADSRALLDLLVRYRESTGAPLFAAHVNHMIRGDEAVRDMRFACETAATAGVHCFTLCADVPALAKQRGQGLELTARQVRYEFFGRIMAENGIPVLVTAHNADDRLRVDAMLAFHVFNRVFVRALTQLLNEGDDFGLIVQTDVRTGVTVRCHNKFLLFGGRIRRNIQSANALAAFAKRLARTFGIRRPLHAARAVTVIFTNACRNELCNFCIRVDRYAPHLTHRLPP